MVQVKKPGSTQKVPGIRSRTPLRLPQSRKQKCTPEQRFRMIQETAYLLAEKADFAGDSFEYWLAAEKEIDGKLAGR